MLLGDKNMLWRKKIPPPEIEWEENPGCFERHLQRRYNNPLFPTERQKISTEELTQARAKDRISQKEFLKQYALLVSEVIRLEGNMSISDCRKCLQDTIFLLKLRASIGGDLENETAVLEKVENNLMADMNASLPEGEELLEKAHAVSMVARIPYMAQLKRSDTPILETEELPTLLSEDMETIRTVGFASREFPDFRPNGRDVEQYLKESMNKGFDANRANEILEAWNSLHRKN
jgi:hypothetical protein